MYRYLPAAALLASPAWAEVPNVVVDFAPVHSIVAQLMGGIGEPALLLPPGQSAHDYAMRPSDARTLSEADIVIWMGPSLTPWLEDPIETLAPDAEVITLLDLPGWNALAPREPEEFQLVEGDGHDHGEEDHDDHGDEDHDDHDDHGDHGDDDHAEHDDHDDHGDDDHAEQDDHDDHGDDDHAEHDDHDDHGDEEHAEHDDHDDHGDEDHAEHDDHGDEDHAGHDHGDTDPHAWLDPSIASLWRAEIAEHLAEHDPDNATAYAAAAEAGIAADQALTSEIEAILANVSGGYIVPHDSLQYFEQAFGVPASGAITLSDAADAGPAHLRALQEIAETGTVTCLLTDTHTSPGAVAILTEGLSINTAFVDYDGTTMTPGPDLYSEMLTNLAKALADCLEPS